MPNVRNVLFNGSLSGIGTGTLQLSSTYYRLDHGITLLADSGNVSPVWVGGSSPITVSGNSPTTDGFPLASGSSVTLLVDSPQRIYAAAAAGSNNKVWWVGS